MSATPSIKAVSLTDALLILLLSLIWGSSYFFTAIAVDELKPLTIVMLRLSIAAFVLWLFLLIKGIKINLSLDLCKSLLVMGILNNATPFLLIVWAQTGITSSVASILNATTPLFTIVVAAIFLKDEPITKKKIFGVLIGFLGVVLVINPFSLGGTQDKVFYCLLMLGATFSYSLAFSYTRRLNLSSRANPIVIATGQVSFAAIITTIASFTFENPIDQIMNASLGIWGAILGLSVLSTSIAFYIYFSVISRTGAVNLSLVAFLIPVFSILLGTTFLNESIFLHSLIGMLFIAFGILIIDGRLWKKLFANKLV